MTIKALYIENNEASPPSVVKALVERDHPDVDLAIGRSYDEAVQLSRQQATPYRLVIADFRFPGPNGVGQTGGVDVCKLFATAFPNIPFFFLSGSDEWEIKQALAERKITLPSAQIYRKPMPLSLIIEIAKKRYLLSPGLPQQWHPTGRNGILPPVASGPIR